MNEKRAIYNLNVDQRTKKFGKGEKLLKYDFQKLPDYIKVGEWKNNTEQRKLMLEY